MTTIKAEVFEASGLGLSQECGLGRNPSGNGKSWPEELGEFRLLGMVCRKRLQSRMSNGRGRSCGELEDCVV